MSVVYPKRPHEKDCPGQLCRSRETVYTDRTGRINPNGCTVTHKYTCNMRWDGCKALVLVPESTLRSLAADAIGEEQR